MSPEQEALTKLLMSFIDLVNGCPQRELHEPWYMSVQRAYSVLPPDVQNVLDLTEDVMAAMRRATSIISIH